MTGTSTSPARSSANLTWPARSPPSPGADREAFYSGAPAKALVATMRKYNGLITREDLEHYQAKLRPPLVGHFRGFDILTRPAAQRRRHHAD